MEDISNLVKKHNSKLMVKICLNVVVACFCYYLSYLFFRNIPELICDGFYLDFDDSWFVVFSILVIILMTVGYILSWRKKVNSGDINESFYAMGFVEYTAGAMVVNHYVTRVTGPAYAISYVFNQGPASLTRIHEYNQSKIPYTTEVVNELTILRSSLKSVDKWEDISIYTKCALSVIYLALLEVIDLDLIKGRVKYSGE